MFYRIKKIFWEILWGQKENFQKEIQEILKKHKNKNLRLEKNIYSILWYRNKTVKRKIKDLKFKKETKNAKFFAIILNETLIELLSEWEKYEDFIKPIIIQVPPHWFKKYFIRGYDQNFLILNELFKINPNLNLQWEPKIIKKIKHTKPQSLIKDKKARRENIKNVFKIQNLEKIKNRNIIIFDDIYTTGATVSEIEKKLKKEKVKNIKILTLAH